MSLKKNPFINRPQHKHGAVPFDDIKLEHFIPALDYALAEAEKPQDEIKELMFETRYHMKSSDNSGLAKVISKALAGASEEKELTEEQVMELLENTEPVPEDPNEDTANGENFIPEDILDPDNALEFAPIDFSDSGDEEF